MNKQEKEKIDFSLKIIRFQLMIILFTIVILVGAMMNVVAWTKNDLKMPVLSAEPFDYQPMFQNGIEHSFYSNKSEVNDWYLTDWIDLHFYIVSPGDIIMILGSIFMLFYLSLYSLYILKSKLKLEEKNENKRTSHKRRRKSK